MILQFVDSIAVSPAVRLDLADGAIWGGKSVGSTFSPPALRYAETDTILTDGAYISASAYDNRVLHLVLDLISNGADAKATALRALNTELNRANNILKYQPGSTPLFFRTIRSSGYQLDEAPRDNYTTVTVDIEAEPFAYGLRVDGSAVVVSADPSQTNGCYVDVNGVTGDVETPAYLRLASGTATDTTHTSVLSVRRHGAPASLQFVFQGESATMGTDTTVAASHDATASGAGNNYATTAFTGSTTATRLTMTLPAGTDAVGTYRVFARVKKTVSSDSISVAMATSGGGGGQAGVTLAVATGWQTVDLGLASFPYYQSDVGYSGVTPGLAASFFNIQLQAQRISGTGNLVWDYALMVPADEELTLIKGVTWDSARVVILDGPNDAVTQLDGSNAAITGFGGPPQRSGRLPMLRPGSNRLIFVQNMPDGISGAGVSDSTTFTVSHWPRWLVV